MTDKRHIFIADAHLENPQDSAYRALLGFLKSVNYEDVESINFLGDTFNFWGEFHNKIYRRYKPLTDTLLELCSSGITVNVVEGNRDFKLSKLTKSSINVYEEKLIFENNELRIGILHGDTLCTEEPHMLKLRKLLRSKPITTLKNNLPEWLAWRVAMIGMQWIKVWRREKAGTDFDKTIPTNARLVFSECDLVVMGHFHQERHVNGQPEIFVLPAWYKSFSYGELSGKEFRILNT